MRVISCRNQASFAPQSSIALQSISWLTGARALSAVRTIETQHRWEKPGITNPGFEVDPSASILAEKFNMKGNFKAEF